ncbi:MAG: hypothetical protein U9R06_01390 [Patescibacteria group bacterium]|nr:hypothetical protein [Patescibacteria group bacterium]
MLEETISEEDRLILKDQVSALETAKSEIEKSLNWEENSLSLFGWFVKLFAK